MKSLWWIAKNPLSVVWAALVAGGALTVLGFRGGGLFSVFALGWTLRGLLDWRFVRHVIRDEKPW